MALLKHHLHVFSCECMRRTRANARGCVLLGLALQIDSDEIINIFRSRGITLNSRKPEDLWLSGNHTLAKCRSVRERYSPPPNPPCTRTLQKPRILSEYKLPTHRKNVPKEIPVNFLTKLTNNGDLESFHKAKRRVTAVHGPDRDVP